MPLVSFLAVAEYRDVLVEFLTEDSRDIIPLAQCYWRIYDHFSASLHTLQADYQRFQDILTVLLLEENERRQEGRGTLVQDYHYVDEILVVPIVPSAHQGAIIRYRE